MWIIGQGKPQPGVRHLTSVTVPDFGGGFRYAAIARGMIVGVGRVEAK
jgi:hypothetical protein